jgi:hypothetical protein
MDSDAEYDIDDLLDDGDTYSNDDRSFEDQCTDDDLDVEAILGTPWRLRFASPNGLNNAYSLGHRSIQQREDLSRKGDLLPRTHTVLNLMRELGIDLATLLYSISGAAGAEFVQDSKIKGERGFLVNHPDFPLILTALDEHCGRRSRAERGSNPLRRFAINNVQRNINREMIALKPLMKMNAQEISIDSILSSHWQQTLEATRQTAPTYWEVLQNAAQTKKQATNNTMKTPDHVRQSSSYSAIHSSLLSWCFTISAPICTSGHLAMARSSSS